MGKRTFIRLITIYVSVYCICLGLRVGKQLRPRPHTVHLVDGVEHTQLAASALAQGANILYALQYARVHVYRVYVVGKLPK